MIEFGNTLHAAREAKGLSVSQLTEQTHILPDIIRGLEAEDFSLIVAPIYGRGFVKLYCEAVGIADPKPLTERFTELYNEQKEARENAPQRRTPPKRKVETVLTPPPAEPGPEPAPAPDPAPTPEPAPEPVPPVVAAPDPAPVAEPDLFAPRTDAPAVPSRAELFEAAARAASGEVPRTGLDPLVPEDRHFRPRIPQLPRRPPSSVIRFAFLGIIAILILWGVIAAIGKLYRLSMTEPADTTDETPVGIIETPPAPPEPTPPAKPSAAPAPSAATPAKPAVIPARNASKPAAKPAAKSASKPAAKQKKPATKTGRKPVEVKPLYFN